MQKITAGNLQSTVNKAHMLSTCGLMAVNNSSDLFYSLPQSTTHRQTIHIQKGYSILLGI